MVFFGAPLPSRVGRLRDDFTDTYNMDDTTSKEKKIADTVHALFPDEGTARRMIDIATAKRPLGWSAKSYSPYYKEFYARQIQRFIDKQLQTHEDILYRYATFCGPEGCSERTLYIRVNQSIKYLIDKLDTDDHKYARWYEMVKIDTKTRPGVLITLNKEMIDAASGSSEALQPELVESADGRAKWEDELEAWLYDDRITQPFVKEGLALTVEEQERIKVQFKGLTNVMVSVSGVKIAVIKINDEVVK